MFASLKSRLALSNLAISLVALVLLTLVFGQLLRQQSEDSNKRFINQEASLVRSELHNYVMNALLPGETPQAFYRQLKGVSQFFHKRIIFYSRTGSCAFDSALYPRGTDKNGCIGADDWRLQPSISNGRLAGTVTRNDRSYYVVQMGTGSRSTAVLITGAGDVIPSLSSLAPGFLLALLAAAIIWVAMSIFFAYSVTRPLTKVTEAARAIAAGDYSRTVDIHGGGEIGQLGSGFNHMVTQVRLANQTLKDFVANVSHDLRTPITVISGFAGSIVDGTVEKESEIEEAAAIIASEATRMEHLVDDLLQLTRLESGLRRFTPSPVVLTEVVDRTIKRVLAPLPSRSIANDVGADLPLAWADEELLERVLANLLNNALAYTPMSGTIRVSAEANGRWMTVRVEDTGQGIASADQRRIFERFYRADRARSGGDGHSGLGLPIVKEIVEAHGGSVSLESEPGAGAAFFFTIPVHGSAA